MTIIITQNYNNNTNNNNGNDNNTNNKDNDNNHEYSDNSTKEQNNQLPQTIPLNRRSNDRLNATTALNASHRATESISLTHICHPKCQEVYRIRTFV